MSAPLSVPQCGMRIRIVEDGDRTVEVIDSDGAVPADLLAAGMRSTTWWSVLVQCGRPCGRDSTPGPNGECRHWVLLSADCFEVAR